MDYLTTHTTLSPIRRGFAPGFVNYKKVCTRLAVASDKVYQLLAHGRWFSPGTQLLPPLKTGRHDIAESGIKHNKSNQINHSLLSKFLISHFVNFFPFSEEPYFCKGNRGRRLSNQLLCYIFDCLYKRFLYDTEGFVTKERFDSLMQPMVDQVRLSNQLL